MIFPFAWWDTLCRSLTYHCVRGVLVVVDLVFGIGDLPDSRPAIPDFIDHEYFALLDREGK